MFRGSSPVTIDSKGRFAIPSAYRAALQEACDGCMVVTQHWDGCLLIYPQPRFQQFVQQLVSRGGLNSNVRDIQRFFVAPSQDVDMDKQGRLSVPATLRNFAQIENRAVLVGMVDLFELWSEDAWYAHNEASRQKLAAQAAADELPEALQDLPL